MTDVRSIEVMVHPGAVAYERETELLRSDWPDRLPASATLISYTELQ